MNPQQDPIGLACLHYINGNRRAKILVKSDFVENDFIPASHLFRSFDEMPDLEKKALQLCKGRILDVGAGSGSHTLYLQEKGFEVTAIEISPLACNVMERRGIKQIVNTNFFDWDSALKFDTILLMMNGIGIVGELKNLNHFFEKIKLLLNPGGQLLIDSSDICYLFEDEDTENIPESMSHYYGEVNYQMIYKEAQSEWFKWLFVDPKMLAAFAFQNNFNCEIVAHGSHYEFLAKLTICNK